MKKFIVNAGRTIIDITATLWAVVIIIAAFLAPFIGNEDFAVTLGIWGICIVALIGFIVSYFLIYLAIDVNDNLCEINKKLSNNKNIKENVEHNNTKINSDIIVNCEISEESQEQLKEDLKQTANNSNVEYKTSITSEDKNNDDNDDDNFLNKGIYKR